MDLAVMLPWEQQVEACYTFFRNVWAFVPPVVQNCLGFSLGFMVLFGVFYHVHK